MAQRPAGLSSLSPTRLGHALARWLGYRLRRRRARPLPLHIPAYQERRVRAPLLDALSDADLERLNEMLDWHAYILDDSGRRFGGTAWGGKRTEPQVIPDRRVALLDERVGLRDKHVLEIGCFEGIHTAALARAAATVTAIDARIENVVKTLVRTAMLGHAPRVFKCDVEQRPLPAEWLRADVAFHVGVLYHLRDPVRHLRELGELISQAVLLDTHYARDEQVNGEYEVDGRSVPYLHYHEWGARDPFSGVYDHSKWLRLRDLEGTLREAGFTRVDVLEQRDERNGSRVLLLAQR